MTIRNYLLMPAALLLAVLTTVACATAENTKLPAPIQALQERGVQIVGTFEAPGGLTGYAAIAGRRPVAAYLTADGEHAIIGSLIDSAGNFVARDTLQAMVAEPMSKRIWAQLENSTWVAEGRAEAPRTVYVFSDPNCPYCYQFWQQAQPWVSAGKVELRHVLVGVISDTSDNKVATILTADEPSQMLIKNKRQYTEGGIEGMTDIPAKVQDKLDANMHLMAQLGLRGTPSVFYRDDQGHVQEWRGLPPQEKMTEIFGAKPG